MDVDPELEAELLARERPLRVERGGAGACAGPTTSWFTMVCLSICCVAGSVSSCGEVAAKPGSVESIVKDSVDPIIDVPFFVTSDLT